MNTDELSIRRGEARDAAAISRFNQAMALETEGKALIPEVIGAGVARLIANPALGFYLVATVREQIVGSLMITTEWSDWRNGIFWWVQSVYVLPGMRRRGVYRRMYEEARALAEAEPGICGFRLYVERDNEGACATYHSLGMQETAYRVYEELMPGVRFLQP
jgi:ribosomal protein S18 acetylase RimI-like enzyme